MSNFLIRIYLNAMHMISAIKINHRLLATIILLTAVVFSINPASATKLYKWVDDQGMVHFSDKIPPQDIKREHSEMDNSGLETKNVEAEKTTEEIAAEKRERERKAEQEKLAKEQAERDRVLLGTYSTEEEIIAARDRKLATMEATNALTKGSIDSLTQRLHDKKKSAADYERQGQEIPTEVRNEINDIKQEIEHHRAMIRAKQKEEENLKQKYQGYIDRFRELKNQ